jgi:hypothetical protein
MGTLAGLVIRYDCRHDLMGEAFDLFCFFRAERDQIDCIESQIHEAGQPFRELTALSVVARTSWERARVSSPEQFHPVPSTDVVVCVRQML